jgi:hypothetical protein
VTPSLPGIAAAPKWRTVDDRHLELNAAALDLAAAVLRDRLASADARRLATELRQKFGATIHGRHGR